MTTTTGRLRSSGNARTCTWCRRRIQAGELYQVLGMRNGKRTPTNGTPDLGVGQSGCAPGKCSDLRPELARLRLHRRG